MKNSINKLLLLLMIVFVGGQSCNDLLDNPQPSTSIDQGVALTDPGAVRAVRASLYGRLHSFDYTTEYFLGPETLADNLNNRSGTNRFSGLAENAVTSGLSSWGTSYNLINDANILITGVEEETIPSDELRQFRGEALALRAFALHHLVRVFGYEPGQTPTTGQGAGFDLGVVIRSEAVLNRESADFRPRSTVSAVYDQIISDLNQSLNLLSQGDAGTVTFVTQPAVEAMLARVHLYAGNYDLANQFATDALNNTPATLAQPGDVASMFDESTGMNPEAIFIAPVDPNTEGQGINNALNSYTATQWVAQVPTQSLMDMYSSGDARLAWYARCFDDNSNSSVSCLATHPDITVEGSMGQDSLVTLETQKWNGEKGNFADDLPFFRVSEMLLIQSEARIKGAPGDPLDPINTLRAARNLGPLAAVDEQDILDERRREFAAEGHRFFDLKRLGRTINKPDELGLSDVTFNDFRVLDNIPFDEVSLAQEQVDRGRIPADSALVQNPGY